jgi:IS5 family transposase
MPLEMMLRIYFTQQWFNLSDPAMEDSLYDSESMRRFAGIELLEDAVPDESTTLRFRHLLEQHRLSEQIFALVRGRWSPSDCCSRAARSWMRRSSMRRPSTKNEAKARDPEMRQGKKNEREWQFGMKALVGTDRRGIVHTLITTSANISDISKMVHLLHGSKREETRPTGARGIGRRRGRAGSATASTAGPIMAISSPVPSGPSTASVRPPMLAVSMAFHVVKNLWGFTKVRYRGLAKNTARLYTMFALANLPAQATADAAAGDVSMLIAGNDKQCSKRSS